MLSGVEKSRSCEWIIIGLFSSIIIHSFSSRDASILPANSGARATQLYPSGIFKFTIFCAIVLATELFGTNQFGIPGGISSIESVASRLHPADDVTGRAIIGVCVSAAAIPAI